MMNLKRDYNQPAVETQKPIPFNPFRMAIQHIWTPQTQADLRNGSGGQEKFICWALRRVATRNFRRTDLEWGLAIGARAYIEQQLGGHITLEGWLQKRGLLKSKINRLSKIRIQLQEHRKAWLEKLADDYDAGLIHITPIYPD